MQQLVMRTDRQRTVQGKDVRSRRYLASWLPLAWSIGFLITAAGSASALTAQIVSDVPSGQPAGTRVIFTLTGDGAGTHSSRLSIAANGNPANLRVMYDLRASPDFAWVPVDSGTYIVLATVRDDSTGEMAHAAMPFEIGPRTPGSLTQAVAVATTHPLVAWYAAPPCPVGSSMRATFRSPLTGYEGRTHAKQCRQGLPMNFMVGGFRSNSWYLLGHEIEDDEGSVVVVEPSAPFLTSSPTVVIPTMTTVLPFGDDSSPESIALHSVLPPGNTAEGIPDYTYAFDSDRELVWYLPQDRELLIRPGGNGTFYMLRDERLTQWDLLGNVVRQTLTTRVSEQLTGMGLDPINNFHHEVRPLPNGHIAVLGAVERIVEDLQGPGEVDVLGDMVVVLDRNLQVAWTWNTFDYLPVDRLATLNETCPAGRLVGCPPVLAITEGTANDWTHSNTITYSPADGNLVVSVRHQDWLVKIDYRNGAGDGHVVWKLGAEGDFTLIPDTPAGWFSHPHDPNYVTPRRISVFDNSNLRCEGVPGCQSRGQIYDLDEVNMTATLSSNIDLGEYAKAVGSSQVLSNGNMFFDSGISNGIGGFESRGREFHQDGTPINDFETNVSTYRIHRMLDMYALPEMWFAPASAPAPGQ